MRAAKGRGLVAVQHKGEGAYRLMNEMYIPFVESSELIHIYI